MVSHSTETHGAAVLQEDALLAYQVCFDLFENEMQSFLLKVSACCQHDVHMLIPCISYCWATVVQFLLSFLLTMAEDFCQMLSFCVSHCPA